MTDKYYGDPEGLGIAPWGDKRDAERSGMSDSSYPADEEWMRRWPDDTGDPQIDHAIAILRRLPWIPSRGWADPNNYARNQLEMERASVLLLASIARSLVTLSAGARGDPKKG